MSVYIIITTVNKKENALKIANELLSRKIAACVSFFPVVSAYRWKGSISVEEEYMLYIKTTKPSEVEEYLKVNHPYELPEILKIEASGSEEYEKWVSDECKA